jgi:hypothetical protein
MKKYQVFFFALIGWSVAIPAVGADIRLDMLDARIQKMEQERAEKYAALQKCEKETKGFKIAGISTLAATGIGVYANIKLHEKLSNMTEAGGPAVLVGLAADGKTQEQRNAHIDDLFAELGMTD